MSFLRLQLCPDVHIKYIYEPVRNANPPASVFNLSLMNSWQMSGMITVMMFVYTLIYAEVIDYG